MIRRTKPGIMNRSRTLMYSDKNPAVNDPITDGTRVKEPKVELTSPILPLSDFICTREDVVTVLSG